MQPEFSLAWIELVALALGPTGAAWVGVRAGLNGQRNRLERVEQSLSRIEDKLERDHESLVKLEANHISLVRDFHNMRDYGCRQLQNHLNILRQLDDTD